MPAAPVQTPELKTLTHIANMGGRCWRMEVNQKSLADAINAGYVVLKDDNHIELTKDGLNRLDDLQD